MAALILIIIFLVGFYWRDDLYVVMCSGGEEEHCAREWLSTFGTVAAAFIAAPALALGLGQIRNASRHHNELLQLQLQPKFALAQRISELTVRIEAARHNLRAFLNHGFDEEFNDEAARKSAYSGAFREYDKIRTLLNSIDFDDFEKDIGSGKPHALGDLRATMKKTFAPSAPSREGVAVDLFLENRDQIIYNAHEVSIYAEACLRQASFYMSRWQYK